MATEASDGSSTARLERWARAINSPFVVTFLGGAALWLVSVSWQSAEDASSRQRELEARAYERKQQLLTQIATELPYTIDLAREYKAREFWLGRHKSDPERARYADFRSFAETRDRYEALKAAYLQRKSASVFEIETRTTFRQPDLRGAASALAASVATIEGLTGEDAMGKLRLAVRDALDAHRRLVEAMAESLVAEEQP